MNDSFIQLDDLPDEILLIIFKKLNKISTLYSLLGVNKRLNTIVHDPIFTSYLALFIRYTNGDINPLIDPILDRFCSQILPEIHDNIKWLNLEPLSMERVLLSTTYPNLYGLGLYNIQEEIAKHLFTDENALTHIFKNQITSLVIDIIKNAKQIIQDDVDIRIFTHTCIFTAFPKLRYLNFGPSLNYYQRLSFDVSSPTFFSSTLRELHVTLKNFTDCLYILNGCFNQLRVLHVQISTNLSSPLRINNTKKLPQLRSFSLFCDTDTNVYDELIVPLLHRMLNLQKLDLYLILCRSKGFVDGNELKKNILDYMPQLNKFIFNIRSIISLRNETYLPTNEVIQKTFRDFEDNQVISCVDYFSNAEKGECHIYSYPYQLKFYRKITNNFPGGLFQCVRDVSLFDEHPFEHEFFLRIAQSFPLMKKLTIINKYPQNNKSSKKSKNDNQDLSIIKYPHFTELDLTDAHDEYAEQFLCHTKMCLPNHFTLAINYCQLKRITWKFTRDVTRVNCSKLKRMYLWSCRRLTLPECFNAYFPHTQVCIIDYLFE